MDQIKIGKFIAECRKNQGCEETMENIIGAVFMAVIAIASFVVSIFQFNQKGFLFNNAYIYASKAEREKMNKKPHYIQSGVLFVMIGIIFTINAVEMLLQTDWLFYLVIVTAVIALVYAVASSIAIEKNK